MKCFSNGLLNIVFLPILTLLFTSCSTSPIDASIKATDIGSLKEISTESIPLRAGYYLGGFSKSRTNLFGPMPELLPDDDLKDMFEQAAKTMFPDIVLIAPKEGVEDFTAEDVDVIMKVRRVFLSDNLGGGIDLPAFRFLSDRLCIATVAARWELTTPDGIRIYFTEVTGEGQAKVPFGTLQSSFWKYRKRAYAAALNDHFKKVRVDVAGNAWWKDPTWK